MSKSDLTQAAMAQFDKSFGASAEAIEYAPGRVNLLGEHTDYNGGLVLPMPLALGTAVAIGRGGDAGSVQIASTAFETLQQRTLSGPAEDHWTDYIVGSLAQVFDDIPGDIGLRIAVATDLPIGSGLSSSAAVEVATLRAATSLFDVALDDVEIAKRARKAENDYVGMPCGIMDQYSVSVGTPGTAVFLDTRTLVSQVAPLPKTHQFVIVHSGVSHKLTEDGYETRVEECHQACAALSVDMLSDLSLDDLPRVAALPAPLDARARHIITENDRVRRAVNVLENSDTAMFAQLMIDSHVSQRDDYAVSVPEVDALVQGALDAGADGARLTGGGFGGSIVALLPNDRVADWCTTIASQFPNARVLAVT